MGFGTCILFRLHIQEQDRIVEKCLKIISQHIISVYLKCIPLYSRLTEKSRSHNHTPYKSVIDIDIVFRG